MNAAVLICCAVMIVLLTVILIRLFKFTGNNVSNEIRNAVEQMAQMREKDNRSLMDQSLIQSKATLDQIDLLGRGIRESQEQQYKYLTDALAKIEEQMNSLRRENQESLEKLSERFENIRRELSSALKNMLEANTENIERLRRNNQESLDRINDTVNEKLQKTLDDKISKSFETVNQQLKEVYKGLGEMRNVASGVNDLKNVLSNVKTRGTLGEIQLGAILKEILAPEQYGEQVRLDPNSAKDERVDFAVKLPGPDGDGIWLPIDSKFPGDTYAALLKSYEAGDADAVKAARQTLVAEIKRCAKSINEKYIKTPYTTNFAIMFLPFEGLYAEVVNMGLIESLQREHHINITGPSTMAAMLNSLQMGFKTLAIQKKSGEVWKILEAAKKEFSNFAVVLENTRDRLRKADEDLEKLVGTRTNQINRKLASVSALESGEEAEKILEN